MAEYLPPTENLAIFDSGVFDRASDTLTNGTASGSYLKYPDAQGTENLKSITVMGVETITTPLGEQALIINNGTTGQQESGVSITNASITQSGFDTYPNELLSTNITGSSTINVTQVGGVGLLIDNVSSDTGNNVMLTINNGGIYQTGDAGNGNTFNQSTITGGGLTLTAPSSLYYRGFDDNSSSYLQQSVSSNSFTWSFFDYYIGGLPTVIMNLSALTNSLVWNIPTLIKNNLSSTILSLTYDTGYQSNNALQMTNAGITQSGSTSIVNTLMNTIISANTSLQIPLYASINFYSLGTVLTDYITMGMTPSAGNWSWTYYVSGAGNNILFFGKLLGIYTLQFNTPIVSNTTQPSGSDNSTIIPTTAWIYTNWWTSYMPTIKWQNSWVTTSGLSFTDSTNIVPNTQWVQGAISQVSLGDNPTVNSLTTSNAIGFPQTSGINNIFNTGAIFSKTSVTTAYHQFDLGGGVVQYWPIIGPIYINFQGQDQSTRPIILDNTVIRVTCLFYSYGNVAHLLGNYYIQYGALAGDWSNPTTGAPHYSPDNKIYTGSGYTQDFQVTSVYAPYGRQVWGDMLQLTYTSSTYPYVGSLYGSYQGGGHTKVALEIWPYPYTNNIQNAYKYSYTVEILDATAATSAGIGVYISDT
jgi:hypothetical protein